MRRPGLGLLGALVLVAAALIATSASTSAPRRLRGAAASRPVAANPAGRGLAAAVAWLEATGRPVAVLGPGEEAPAPGDVWLLLAPVAPLPRAEAERLLDHAARGGLAVWALGPSPQPALERALGAARSPGRGERTSAGVPGHPLLGGLALGVGRDGVTSSAPGAHPATGPEAPPAAVSVPVGRGEVLLLGDPAILDNAHLPESDALSLWVRLAARGRVVLDERWGAPADGGAGRTAGVAALVGLQALLAALLLLLALGRRHGAVRPLPAPASRRTARDYLAALAALSRRAGAEPALAAASWRRLRRRLEREAGVPARLPDEAAARRLSGRPGAAEAVRRGAAALRAEGPGQLLAVTRAAADAEAALRRPAAPAPAFAAAPIEGSVE